jgi:electron transfer flavoprotein alpha subunit
VANLLVYIEPLEDAASPGRGCVPGAGAMQALGEGRRLASALGARMHAFVPWRRPGDHDGDHGGAHSGDHGLGDAAPDAAAQHWLIATMSQHGADHVVLAPVPPGPPLWATHGEAVVAACQRLQPLLVLMAATPAGRDLAPRLAARLEAAFYAEPMLFAAGAELLLSRPVYGAGLARRVALEELDRPAVVTLAAGRHRLAFGDDDAAVTTLARPHAGAPACELLGSERDAGAALDGARVIVTAGAGVTERSLALVRALAEALGGELGATRSLCERGLVPGERAIDIGTRRVAPALYVACAASGSATHLGAVSPETAIVAINEDPDAPVFRSARYGLVGSVENVIPTLLAALQRRAQATVSP